jgi:hypothetical protein
VDIGHEVRFGDVTADSREDEPLPVDKEGERDGRSVPVLPSCGRAGGLELPRPRSDPEQAGVAGGGSRQGRGTAYALLAQGEQVHISTYPPSWPSRRPGNARNYDLTRAIEIRAAAHAFEGKVFNIVAAGVLDEAAVKSLQLARFQSPAMSARFRRRRASLSSE